MNTTIPLDYIRGRLSPTKPVRSDAIPRIEESSDYESEINMALERILTPDDDVVRQVNDLGRLSPMAAAGHVVRIENVGHLDLGGEREELGQPVSILLDASIGELNGHAVWKGWFVTPDIDYATHFDLIRTNDPSFCEAGCDVIQCWNPVVVYEPSIHEVVGRVGHQKLDAARKLASDFARSAVPPESDVGRFGRPGDLIYRQIGGAWQQTGCWLDRSAISDVRNEYIELYSEFARRINAPIERALDAREQVAAKASSTAPIKVTDALGAGLALAANRAASVFLSWADTVASAFRLESVGNAPMHAAGGLPDRFLFERGEYVDVDVDYDTKIVKVSSCFDPEGRRYKLFFLNQDNEVVAHVPREKDGYLSIDRFDGDFEERCPEIFQGLKMEIREVRDSAAVDL